MERDVREADVKSIPHADDAMLNRGGIKKKFLIKD
jgi:hypothetical protein